MEGAGVCRVALLGHKSPESGFRLRTAKHRAVLAALLLDSAPVERMELALRFWPDQADPLNHLRQAVADIRRAYGGDALLAEGKTLRLRARERFRTDVDDLQELLAEARATPDSAERLPLLQMACGLGTGDFLQGLEDGDPGGWIAETRERVHGWLAEANLTYAHALEERGRLPEAWQAASEAMRWNPADPDVADTVLRLGLAIDARHPIALAGNGSLERIRRAEREGRPLHPQEARTLLAAFGVRLAENAGLRDVAEALAGFKGSFTAEQARAIAGVRATDLAALAAARILAESGGRYAMVESLRRLLWRERSPAEAARFAARHARHLARRAREQPESNADEGEGLAVALHWHLLHGKPAAVLRFLETLHAAGLFDLCAAGGDWCLGLLGDLRQPLPLRREAALFAGRLAVSQHRFAAAIPHFEAGLALPEADDERPAASGWMSQLAFACHHASRPVEAEAWGRRAIEAAAREGDSRGYAHALRFLGEILWAGRRLDEAAAAIGEAVALHESLPECEAELGETIFQLATLQSLLGQSDAAHANYLRSLENRLALGNAHGIADCLRGLALIQARRGQTVEAWAHARHAVALYRSIAKIPSSAAALGDLAEVHICRGEYEKALDHLEEALAIWQSEAHPTWIARVQTRIAEVLDLM